MDIKTTIQPNGEWTAIDADTYEAECDSAGWFSTCPMGYGRTREAAIGDLLDQIIEKLKDQNDADRRHLSDLPDLQERPEDPGAANASRLQEVSVPNGGGAEQAPDREPVGMALNSIINVLDGIVAMTKDPATYKEVAAEEISLGRVISRAQLVLSFIDSRKPRARVVEFRR